MSARLDEVLNLQPASAPSAAVLSRVRDLPVPSAMLSPKCLTTARRLGTLPWELLSRTVKRLSVPDIADIISVAL